MLFLNDWITFTSSDSDPNKRSFKLWNDSRSVSDDLVRATFEITPEDIKKLREKVLFKMDDDNAKPIHLSTFVLTYAYAATCLVKAKGGKGDRPVCILFTADCRTRLDPPSPITYFGNCVLGFRKSAKASNFMDENGFAFAVDMLSELVEGLKKEVLDGVEKKVRLMLTAKVPRLQLKFYESDFGLARLNKVEIVSIDRNETNCMIESRDGSGGVEVGLVLKKHEMETFAFLFSDGLKTII
ncbi:hypothetical protein REPUB_Repub01dG0182300 [Reevesia pubescens]